MNYVDFYFYKYFKKFAFDFLFSLESLPLRDYLEAHLFTYILCKQYHTRLNKNFERGFYSFSLMKRENQYELFFEFSLNNKKYRYSTEFKTIDSIKYHDEFFDEFLDWIKHFVDVSKLVSELKLI